MASPSDNLLASLRAELTRFAPFAQMDGAHVDRFIRASSLAYFAPGETVLSPDDGPVRDLYVVRRGRIARWRGEGGSDLQIDAGDFFPVGAALSGRAVGSTYRAHEDTFCLLLPVADVESLAAASAPFADFLNARIQHFLDLSRRALQLAWSSQSLTEQSLEARLDTLALKPPVAVRGDASLGQALALMSEHRVGSVLVLDAAGAAEGIVTRHDLLDRVVLPQAALSAPVVAVMSAPVLALTVADSVQDAALLMARHGIRHVPVTDAGRVVGIVSERDLFAMQRLSLSQVSTAIRSAGDVEAVVAVAPGIARLAGALLGQGIAARQLTELISHLNDLLTERLVQLIAEAHGADLRRACWLTFGSQGRGEQTVATDQDNGLVFASERPERDRPAWLAFGNAVNQALAACGFELCKGGIMAGQPACCLTADEWRARYERWIEHGAPRDLLDASIFFDARALAGNAELMQPVREQVLRQAMRTLRFIKQMADDALANAAPLNWLGGIETHPVAGREVVNLKLHGTMPFTSAARVYALAHGVAATGTRRRFEAIAPLLHVEPRESSGWIGAFEFLLGLRLRVQAEAPVADRPNLVEVAALNDIDRRVLKEAFRSAQSLQQRLELDYRR